MIYLKIFSQTVRVAIFLGVITACSPTGDFGRVSQPQKNVFDTFPTPQDPQNYSLAQSDEENLMQNLMQRFVSTIEGKSWLSEIRFGAKALSGIRPDQTDYFLWLKSRPYASSTGRYRTLLNEVQLDILSLPNVFAAVCVVQKTDERRSLAASSLERTSPQTLQAITQRQQGNNRNITSFVERVKFRYASYSYALENLLVETPDEIAREVDDKLNILAAQVQIANSNQFCA